LVALLHLNGDLHHGGSDPLPGALVRLDLDGKAVAPDKIASGLIGEVVGRGPGNTIARAPDNLNRSDAGRKIYGQAAGRISGHGHECLDNASVAKAEAVLANATRCGFATEQKTNQ
jgi:hypothetical protein